QLPLSLEKIPGLLHEVCHLVAKMLWAHGLMLGLVPFHLFVPTFSLHSLTAVATRQAAPIRPLDLPRGGEPVEPLIKLKRH
ncbi:MAG: hypothetical protein V3V07_00210, partial [candidate division NC10 bacterium]